MTSAKPKRPRRKRKSDRLISPGASKEEIMCDHALAPFDRMSREMEERWGVERLPELVSVETAQKFGSAMAKLNAAIEANDPAEVATRANVCIRGLQAMDAEAKAAGHKEATGEFLEYALGDFHFAVLRDEAQWQTARSKRPDLMFFTLREIAQAMKAYCQTVPIEAVKRNFPESQITKLPEGDKLPKDFFDLGGDYIPF